MRAPLLAAATIIALTVLFSSTPFASAQAKDAPQQESAPDVPDAIAMPEGLQPVLFVHASGSQIYTCQADDAGKYSWTLKAPDAELKDRKDKVIGQHSAGPTWKLKDGSEVTGKAAGHVDSLDSDSIPWLLVDVVNNSAKAHSRRSRRFSVCTRTAANQAMIPATNHTKPQRRRAHTPPTITSMRR